MKRQLRKYTEAFKREAVNLALSSLNIESTAKDLDVPTATLYGWINKRKEKGNLSQVDDEGSKAMADLLEENRRLQKALAIAKEERDILKKAAAYFAQHQK